MKCLSIWQPWASLIACGAKRYETRGWRPPARMVGQRIAIHAARSLEGFKISDLEIYLRAQVQANYACQPRSLPLGVIVATAMIFDIRSTDQLMNPSNKALFIGDSLEHLLGDFSSGRYGWRLTSIRRLTTPIKCHGKQGLFDLPDDVVDAVVDDQHDPNCGNWGDSHAD